MTDWQYFHGDGKQRYRLSNGTLENQTEQPQKENLDQNQELKYKKFPAAPPWRKFLNIDKLEEDQGSKEEFDKRWKEIQDLAGQEENKRGRERGEKFRIHVETKDGKEEITEAGKEVISAVNAALYLRRPLLVTGNPGSGKTSLAYAIAHELQLGPVLTWSITARSTLQDGLYRYDAIGRFQDAEKQEGKSIGDYITLGALGTAFLPSRLPRVLLIDEIDKSDINLPNDLLHIFEEGGFNIPELARRAEDVKTEKVCTSDVGIKAAIHLGKVRCAEFPIVIMTSNGEREFPPAFLRRCLRVIMPDPKAQALKRIVKAHFENEQFNQAETVISKLIDEFLTENDRATDQLLNIVYLLTQNISPETLNKDGLKALLFKRLSISDEL
jgi:MoxR-like ATPase